MPAYRKIVVDGVLTVVQDDPPAAYKNPPLTALNSAYRADDTERRGEVNDTVEKINGALQAAFVPGGKRRVQKSLRAPL